MRLESMSSKQKWLAAGAIVIVSLIIGLTVIAIRLRPIARDKVVEFLEQRFQSKVELANVSVSLMPLSASGEGLVFRHKGRTDVPPLIQMKRFRVDASYLGLIRSPRHVSRVTLEGLRLTMPPKRDKSDQDSGKDNGQSESAQGESPWIVDEIVADGTVLTILPKKEGKTPLEWDLHELTLTSVGAGKPMEFVTKLENAKPPGLIDSHGHFGPWNGDDPGQSPVDGEYTFKNADLGVFKGITGTLSSEGRYAGRLESITVDGTTDTPNFALRISQNPMSLRTQFHAIVDGTNGETLLQPVKADLAGSKMEARGGVVETPGRKGKTVRLDVHMPNGRMEDLMLLAVRSPKPPMTGAVRFDTKLEIPPGDIDVAEKMLLDGQFSVKSARFSDKGTQAKINKLSQRSRGDSSEEPGEPVASDLSGKFKLADAVIRFSQLEFGVPGAHIRLAGDYKLKGQDLDFQGEMRMQAKVSETQNGFKRALLKVVDPLFKRDGAGAVIPLSIGGSKDDPQFKLDFKRVLKRK